MIKGSILQANWFTADRFCRSRDAELFVAEDHVEKVLVTDYLKKNDLIAERYWDSMWAGINCLGNRRNFVRAKDGSSVFLDWMRAEPNNRGGYEDCVSFVNYGGGVGLWLPGCQVQLPSEIYLSDLWGIPQVKH